MYSLFSTSGSNDARNSLALVIHTLVYLSPQGIMLRGIHVRHLPIVGLDAGGFGGLHFCKLDVNIYYI